MTIYYDASPVVVSTSSLAAGQVGSPYSATLAGAGGIPAYQWSISSGSLPGGLALDPNTGIISGTPTSAGTASITVKLTDSSGPVAETASAQLALTIRPAAVPSVWVVNTANSQVHSFPLGSAGNAAPLNTLSGATTGLGSGGGVTLDSRGQVYVADPQSNSVTEYPNAANGEYRGHLRRTKTHRNLPVPDHGY